MFITNLAYVGKSQFENCANHLYSFGNCLFSKHDIYMACTLYDIRKYITKTSWKYKKDQIANSKDIFSKVQDLNSSRSLIFD